MDNPLRHLGVAQKRVPLTWGSVDGISSRHGIEEGERHAAHLRAALSSTPGLPTKGRHGLGVAGEHAGASPLPFLPCTDRPLKAAFTGLNPFADSRDSGRSAGLILQTEVGGS